MYASFEQLWAIQPEAFTALMQQYEALQQRSEGGGGGEQTAPQAAMPITSPQTITDAPPRYSDIFPTINGVAIIEVEAVIMRNSTVSRYSGEVLSTGLLNVQTKLRMALEDTNIKAILFSFYSPGGQAAGVKELADSIALARRQKPCAAWVDGLCASAAYWLASATGRIFAGPSSTVGSIGVLYRHTDVSGLNDKIGLAYTYVTAGSHKSVGNPDSPLSERDSDVLQGRVNAIYDMFTADVAQHMGLAVEARDKWADGRCFLAQEALELGLITALISDKNTAITTLLKETSMKKEEYAAKFPEQFAAIQQEAVAKAQAELAKNTTQANSQADAQATAQRESMLAMVQGLCGPEKAAQIQQLMTAGVTAEMFAALVPVLGIAASSPAPLPTDTTSGTAIPPSADVTPQATATNAQVLAGILAASPQALVAGQSPQINDETARIQRIAKL